MTLRRSLPAALALASTGFLAGCPNIVLTTGPLGALVQPSASPGANQPSSPSPGPNPQSPAPGASASPAGDKASPAPGASVEPKPSVTPSAPVLSASALPKIEASSQPADKVAACGAEAGVEEHHFLPTFDGGKPALAGWKVIATNIGATKQYSWGKLAAASTPVKLYVPEGCEMQLALVRADNNQTEKLFTVAVNGKDSEADPIKVDFPALESEGASPEPSPSVAPSVSPSAAPSSPPPPAAPSWGPGVATASLTFPVYTYANYLKPTRLRFVLHNTGAAALARADADIDWEGALPGGQPKGTVTLTVPVLTKLDVYQIFEDGKVVQSNITAREVDQNASTKAWTPFDIWCYDYP